MPTYGKNLLKVGERVQWNGKPHVVVEREGQDDLYGVKLVPEDEPNAKPVRVSPAAYHLKHKELVLLPGMRLDMVPKKPSREGVRYYLIECSGHERFGEGRTPREAAQYAFGFVSETMKYKDCGTRRDQYQKKIREEEWRKMP